tara:strand:+ start:9501 stop:10088 length:588 start_codon:yes stop_codon:yes gene_type:complete
MAFIKTEVNTDLDKKVAGKGVDYIAKELENIRADYSKKINNIYRSLGVDVRDEDINLANEDNILHQNIQDVNTSFTSAVGSQVIKSYTTGQQSIFTWGGSGSNNSHTLASGISFDLLSGSTIVNMFWKVDGTWVLFTPMGEDMATSDGMGLIFTSSTIKLVYKGRNSHMPIKLETTYKQLDNDATHYKVNVLNIT